MTLLELPGWVVEYDRDATIAVHARAPAYECSCAGCQNWTATREQILPASFRALLDRLGVPSDHEVEVYHLAKLASGLHRYGGWYHFVGHVVSGERECSPDASFGAFKAFFHSSPALLAPAFDGLSVVQLEIEAETPWLSGVPELS